MFAETLIKSNKPLEALMFMLISILISTFLLKFLWNRGLVPFVTILRPLKNMQEAFLLSLGLFIIRGCQC